MDNFSEGLKKVMLAGIGAIALTAEKSGQLIDDMIERGELTVEQGKALNKELKHTVEKAKADAASKADTDAQDEDAKAEETNADDKCCCNNGEPDVEKFLSKLSPEQLKSLKEQLDKADTQ